ncbi:MAG TPA: carboxypeptidase-like regulatory domain-containing protein, partial [Stellaceae bacterium]|nr:carboxypeptidase-like regulatory domain-containing protein [Stellaceae bacterium]
MRTSIVAFVLTLAVSALPNIAGAQQPAGEAVRINERAIGGVVTGAQGPEGGVWVIAETTELPTKLAKIVVTDERGRYVIPDLPAATYDVWVRGYGLVDSPKVQAAPGKTLDLKTTAAPDAKAAAQYYPALYWYALLQVPPAGDFPGKGMPEAMKSQGQWLDIVKTDGCFTCHALGNAATRAIPPQLGKFESTAEAWEARIQSGQAATNMVNNIGRLDTQRALKLFADWTDRIAAGALPSAAPQRPQGVERNLVVTLWDWSDGKAYLHDSISSDRRDPTVNAGGLLYGATEESTQDLPVLDPVKNVATTIHIPVRDPNTPSAANLQVLHAS